MKKKFRDLTFDDLGKHAVVTDPESGDRNSGAIETIAFYQGLNGGYMNLKKIQLTLTADQEVEFTD